MRRLAVILIGIFLSPALISAPSATASSGQQLCETSGNYCVSTSSLKNYGSAVYEASSGRRMAFETDYGVFCLGRQCFPTGILRFTSGTNACAVADPAFDGLVVVE